MIILEILADIIVLGLWDGIAFLFSGEKTYKFITLDLKNGKKFRIRSVYFKKNKKYRIRIEELIDGKFHTVKNGTFTDESVVEGFHKKQLEISEVRYNLHEYDRLKFGELKSVMDNIGWNQTK